MIAWVIARQPSRQGKEQLAHQQLAATLQQPLAGCLLQACEGLGGDAEDQEQLGQPLYRIQAKRAVQPAGGHLLVHLERGLALHSQQQVGGKGVRCKS